MLQGTFLRRAIWLQWCGLRLFAQRPLPRVLVLKLASCPESPALEVDSPQNESQTPAHQPYRLYTPPQWGCQGKVLDLL